MKVQGFRLYYFICALTFASIQIFFIASSAWVCYVMKMKYPTTWDPALDTFRVEFLLGPSLLLSLIFNYAFTFSEVRLPFHMYRILTFIQLKILWSFSIFLESVAILPQLFQLTRTGEAETITSHYLFALGTYRGLYILNWIYRYFFDTPAYHGKKSFSFSIWYSSFLIDHLNVQWNGYPS
jgi:ER lumen protein retaining receptor